MPWPRRVRRVLAVAAAVASISASLPAAAEPVDDPIGSVQVFLTPEAALAQAFPAADRFDREALAIPADLRELAAARGERPFAADSTAFYIARDSAGAAQGYALFGDEIGKYRPITYMVATDPELRVTSVAILVYRESRGGEVRRQRFLRQYRGKGLDDPVRINRDIVNITGATMSVRALNTGVRKALLLLDKARERRTAG